MATYNDQEDGRYLRLTDKTQIYFDDEPDWQYFLVNGRLGDETTG